MPRTPAIDLGESRFRNGTQSTLRLTAHSIEALCGTALSNGNRLDYIDGVSTPDRLLAHRVVFIDRYSAEIANMLVRSTVENVLVVAVEGYREAIPQASLISQRPRMKFAEIVRKLFGFRTMAQTERISPSAKIDPTAKISVGVTIGNESKIGSGTLIYPNVTIGDRVSIGENCCVKSGSVIGQAGFAIYRDEWETPHLLPHVGGVMIGDNVELGALNTVASGTIHPTIVENHVKTDDHVHIAHNCHIGTRTLLTACAELSGSVRIGANCWIGPNASIRDGLRVGDGAFVGIGSNVVTPVPPGATVYGNPARERLKD